MATEFSKPPPNNIQVRFRSIILRVKHIQAADGGIAENLLVNDIQRVEHARFDFR